MGRQWSAAEQRAMKRRTATEISDEVYHAAPARRRRTPGGFPDPSWIYRKTDHDLLAGYARAAFDACLAAIAPAERRAEIGALLEAEVDQAYPVADMAVLKRYGATREIRRVHVMAPGMPIENFELARPRAVPAAIAAACMGYLPFFPDGGGPLAVPPAAMPFFEQIHAARRRRHHDFDRAPGWAQHLARHDRAPAWSEIETTFPAIGAWLAEQRSRA